MIEQDSSDPTGISVVGPEGGISPSRARQRKATAALSLKLSGANNTDIAKALGYPTPRAVQVAIEQALARELRENPSDRARMRQMAALRLDRLLRSVWPKAIDNADPEHLLATTKARELIAQWSKLHGLDAPQEVIVHSPTESAIEEWVAKVITLGLPPVEEDDVIDVEYDEHEELEA